MPTAEQPFAFKPGDLVRLRSDPAGVEAILWEVAGYAPAGQVRSNFPAFYESDWPYGIMQLVPWGERTSGRDVHDTPVYYILERRPAPGERFPSRIPCPADRGADGAVISAEFVEALVQHYWPGGRAYEAWEADYRRDRNTRPIGHASAAFQIAAFLLGNFDIRDGTSPHTAQAALEAWQRTTYTNGGYGGVAESHSEMQRFRAIVWRTVTWCANRLDPEHTRCMECAALGRTALVNSEQCPHFNCVYCMIRRETSCQICTDLYREDVSEFGNSRVCSRCCQHRQCGCGANVDARRRCGQGHCEDCCDCPTCVDCWTTRDLRDCCGNCNDHCECASHCFPLKKYDLYFFKAPTGERGMTRLLGTELETYTARTFSPELKKAQDKWLYSVVTDGSIGSNGVEIVTQPAGGSQWREMIKDIGEGFKTSTAKTAPSCGQHVHVDAGDLNVWDLRRVIKLYAHIEQSLFDALPEERMKSDYCFPCGDEYLQWINGVGIKPSKKLFAYKQYGVEPPKFGPGYINKTKAEAERAAKKAVDAAKRGKYHQTRYKALNMHSYWHRGTIEFRHAHGTCNPEQITNWGLLCGSIIDFCAKSSDKQLAEVLALSNRDALLSVLGKYALTDVAAWLSGRWLKFTNAPGKHFKGDLKPKRDPATGEV